VRGAGELGAIYRTAAHKPFRGLDGRELYFRTSFSLVFTFNRSVAFALSRHMSSESLCAAVSTIYFKPPIRQPHALPLPAWLQIMANSGLPYMGKELLYGTFSRLADKQVADAILYRLWQYTGGFLSLPFVFLFFQDFNKLYCKAAVFGGEFIGYINQKTHIRR